MKKEKMSRKSAEQRLRESIEKFGDADHSKGRKLKELENGRMQGLDGYELDHTRA